MNPIFRRHLARRTFLRGAGATLALPFLDAMRPAFARAASVAPPVRLSFAYVPNGIIMPDWKPAEEGSAYTFTRILKPLEPLREDVLVLSGLAMEIAGSSRPCSGAEHLISHALDSLRPGTAQHGEQVAFGALVATHLQGGDWNRLREFMLSAGMTDAASGFGLGERELTAAVRAAPSMRPDRYTILSDAGSTEARVAAAVRDVLAA